MSDPQSVSKPIASRHALRNVRAFRRTLLNWFARYGADYPWRKTRDPYAILVSEIMLQQTQVATVIPYFEAFMASFPDVQALAAAPVATRSSARAKTRCTATSRAETTL